MVRNVIFYRDPDNSDPVAEFLRSLAPKERAKAIRLVQLLKEHGLDLGFPYTSHVRGKIWEARTSQAGANLRLLYASVSGQVFVVLAGFTKSTKKTPEAYVKLAEQRLADWESRRK